MFVGLRAAFVALAGMALVAASNALPAEPVAVAVPGAPQPDRSYAFVLDGTQPSPTHAVDARLSYDFSSQLDDVAEHPAAAPVRGGSLKALVNASEADTADLDPQLRCLATAVYFESKGEPLEGQLAVAQVILNRVESRRFADSICGVVNQPKQFSFSRNTAVRSGSRDWRTAVAIARIAQADRWQEIAPDALFFHANYVAPSWRQNRVKISQVGAHIFYR